MSPGARHFHEELAQLKKLLLDMSALAEEQVRAAVRALHDRDAEAARAVIRADSDLDTLENWPVSSLKEIIPARPFCWIG